MTDFRSPTLLEGISLLLWAATDPDSFEQELAIGNGWDEIVNRLENHAQVEGIQ